MAKLKFDRSINIKTKPGEKVTVPNDEVWKGTIFYATQLDLNGNRIESIKSPSSGGAYLFNPMISNITLGGGTIFFSTSSYNGTVFTGVAFKVI